MKTCKVYRPEQQTFTAHGDAVGDSNCIVLPSQHIVLDNMLLDLFSKIQYCGELMQDRERYAAVIEKSGQGRLVANTVHPGAFTYGACCSVIRSVK
jgi:hypothetical protein